ncbi:MULTISPECIES: rhodanese-like domain-containing protein [unclassified Undibacterium]|uniref:rhodanese-like domain-containing protein n=1 Tax=unclassified Undibacterium TaxID=2630295 RepID=UPI00164ACD15|nr:MULTISPECIES: rhodanese-like domain-containing protein [unclassified Undibacterium]MBC3878902.1 rhodanese-like domain-containing protein [Undibacterium sp. FT79W]MBC3928353.1 rhodanese-like domain-containing protein [Undibacterium sp. CY21W]
MSLLGKLIGAFAGTEQELPANAILIDVRSSGEYQAGYIAGAVSLPLGEVGDRIHSVVPDKDAPVIVYCQSGARSASAKNILSNIGYTNVANGGGVGSLALRLQKQICRL